MVEELQKSASIAPLHLLVIEDDASTSLTISKIGQAAGFATWTATSLETANSQLRARRYDCITLDLQLGKESGAGR